MRIGFDVSATCIRRTGVGWYADRLIRSMAEIAPENEYILFHRFGSNHDTDPAKGTQLPKGHARLPYQNLTPAESAELWEKFQNGKNIYRKPQIVHANSFQAPSLPGTNLIYTVYDVTFWAVPEFTFEVNRAVCQKGTLDAMKNAEGFLFISESARNEFDRIFPGWLADSGIPHAVTLLGGRETPAMPHSATRDGSGKHWLFVGSLEPRKNLKTLLNALDVYWEKSAAPRPLKLAGGDGCESDAVRQKIADQQSRGMVQPLGYVSEDRLTDLYAEATAFLFPSWHEGFGLPVLEAMSAGCPVITSDRTSLPEVGGDAVLYVDPESPHSIAEAMLRLESDPALRARLTEQGLERAKKFSWESTARQTLDFYEEVLSRSGKPRRSLSR